MDGEAVLAAQLREKLRKIESLFAGATTPGERDAADAARQRVRARLAALKQSAPAPETRFSFSDRWSLRLFLALARRHGLRPYRYPRQRRSTVMLRVAPSFLKDVLWPEYVALSEMLNSHLEAVTMRVIRQGVHGDTSEAAEATGEWQERSGA